MTGSPADGSVSVLVLRALLMGAQALGVELPRLAREAGLGLAVLTPESVADPDGRVPARTVLALWQTLPELSGHEHFGLWLAEVAKAAPISPAAWFILSSPTLEVGLERVVRFQRLLHDRSQSQLRRDENELCYVHQVGDPAFRAPRHAIEFGFAQAVWLVRRALGRTVFPSRVHFQHAAPKDIAPYAALFGRGVTFGASSDELAFARQTCELPLVTQDDALSELVLAHARVLLERLPTDTSWATRVRSAIVRALPRDLPDLERVAQTLSSTKRTLQRRLAEEGTSFEEIFDAVRRELAERYLNERRLSVQECAFLLGYSDLSAFHRAFSRWHGVSPTRFRSGVDP